MQNQQNNDFVNGLFVDYTQTQYGTITKLGIHRDNFINWLMQQQVSDKGYVKVDILTARETGKPYAKLNTYQAQPQQQGQYQQQQPQQQPQQQYQQQAPAVAPQMQQQQYQASPQQQYQPPQGVNDPNIPF